jgi:hypothetical protein
MPMSDGTGNVKFYSLKTKMVIQRDAWNRCQYRTQLFNLNDDLAHPGIKRINTDPTSTYNPDGEESDAPDPESVSDPMTHQPVTPGHSP